MMVEQRPDCDICGKPYSAHNMGHGYPMCGIYPLYRPKPSLAAPMGREDEDSKIDALIKALEPIMPISTNDTADYAELYFGEHQTQAMTMVPQTWLEINEAFAAMRRGGESGK